MKVFVISLLTIVVVLGENVTKNWESFKALHGKQHSRYEESFRNRLFLKKVAEIEAHNVRYEAGLESFSRKINQYSDLTPEEFEHSALGFVAAMNVSSIPFLEESSIPLAAVPASFDWRDEGIVTPVKNQLYCGSCYAFAASSVLESYIKRKKGKTLDLSEQDVVDCSYKKYMRKQHNGGCAGGWPSAVFDYYNDKDLVPTSKYPYTSGTSKTHGTCQIPKKINNVLNGKLKHKHVRTKTEDEMAQLLVTKGPLVIAMAADMEYKKYFNDLGDGVFDMDHTIKLTPNHAVVIVGYGSQDGKDYWVIKNSWGKGWAKDGYGKIRRGKNMCNLKTFGVWYIDE